ncbi:hypothetical protein Y1Q_0023321 [Alligator mississippiensis]|uniref:Uncharacterized protein n=1 Tax=Alligator mississippiensis TaxID=8496 RepID=A0A151NQ29_ALLMI|nr:hypothetical protein Y1Q_0023321 [Alligator mississippiensis]
MNSSRRIHSLRAHRPKAPANMSENWHSSCRCKQDRGDELSAVHTLYTVIIMVILMVIWGAWARKDAYL